MADADISSEADAARKEALRKAGQDYFETILAKAAAGRDPFVADAAARRRPADVEAADPDMETVGLVLKGAKLYIIGALFFAATTMRLVLASVSLDDLVSFLGQEPVTSLGKLLLAHLTIHVHRCIETEGEP